VTVARDFGFDEVNLNVGCPSDRVQSGCFGAALMRTPALVADCAAAMIEAAGPVPVTVKCRIGVDAQDPETVLPAFLQTVAACRGAPCHHPRPQGLAAGAQPEGEPRDPAARPRPRAAHEGGVPAALDRDQRRDRDASTRPAAFSTPGSTG
jgi:hypothetical protein